MLLPVAATLDRLVTLTAPGAPVAPVIAALDEVAAGVAVAHPALEQAKASAWLLGQMDRVQGMATQLAGALRELAANDGMTTFDPAFAADDAAWDANFREHAELVRRAETVLDGAEPAMPAAAAGPAGAAQLRR
jgi:hypothetical protein